MSGGYYEYAYFQLEKLAEDIESEFKNDGKYFDVDWDIDGDFSYKSRPEKEFDIFEHFTSEEKTEILREIKLLIYQLKALSKKAKSLEWAMSGDTNLNDFAKDCKSINLEGKQWVGE